MKYLYKPEAQWAHLAGLLRFWGQGLPGRTNAQLFVWHAALMEKASG